MVNSLRFGSAIKYSAAYCSFNVHTVCIYPLNSAVKPRYRSSQQLLVVTAAVLMLVQQQHLWVVAAVTHQRRSAIGVVTPLLFLQTKRILTWTKRTSCIVHVTALPAIVIFPTQDWGQWLPARELTIQRSPASMQSYHQLASSSYLTLSLPDRLTMT